MRKQEIVKGGVYWDGAMGVRKILDMGPQYRQYSHRADRDCVQYQVLSDCKQGIRKSRFDESSIKTSARQSFATWAKQRLDTDTDTFHDVMESISAKGLRLKKPATDAILALSNGANPGRLSGKPLEPRQVDPVVMAQLERMGIVATVGTGGSSHGHSFTRFGVKVVERLRHEQRPTA